MHGQ